MQFFSQSKLALCAWIRELSLHLDWLDLSSRRVQASRSACCEECHFHILVTDGLYFPDGSYFALGFWDQPALLSELRHSILKSLVARNCLQPETAKLLESWPLDRSGFSAFVGDPINQPADRPRLQRVLNYILRRL